MDDIKGIIDANGYAVFQIVLVLTSLSASM